MIELKEGWHERKGRGSFCYFSAVREVRVVKELNPGQLIWDASEIHWNSSPRHVYGCSPEYTKRFAEFLSEAVRIAEELDKQYPPGSKYVREEL